MRIVAHRGRCKSHPENTMGSVRAGWKTAADGVEVDVRVTRDRRVVIIHDEDTLRMAQKKLLVCDSLYEELCELDFGAGERIPLLSDALQTVPRNKMFFIEIKSNTVTKRLLQVISDCPVPAEQIVFLGFPTEVDLRNLKKEFPEYPVHLIIQRDEKTELKVDNVIQAVRDAGADGIQLGHPEGQLLDGVDVNFVKAIKNAGLGIHLWTVNDPKAAERFMNAGVDGVTSDEPEMLVKELFSR